MVADRFRASQWKVWFTPVRLNRQGDSIARIDLCTQCRNERFPLYMPNFVDIGI